MKFLRMIGVSILSFLGMCILITVLVLVILFTYFPLQSLIFAKGDYLLFVSSEKNLVPVIMIALLIIYLMLQIIERYFSKKTKAMEFEEEPMDDAADNQGELIEIPMDMAEGKIGYVLLIKFVNKLFLFERFLEKVYKIIKVCYVPALIIAIYYGMTSYTILYGNQIKVGSPLNPLGITYAYEDVKKVDLGIEKYKSTYTPYYKITLKDNTRTDIFGGSISEYSDANFEEILINFDNALVKKGIKKNVDKSDFDKFAKGLDANYVKEIERIFE